MHAQVSGGPNDSAPCTQIDAGRSPRGLLPHQPDPTSPLTSTVRGDRRRRDAPPDPRRTEQSPPPCHTAPPSTDFAGLAAPRAHEQRAAAARPRAGPGAEPSRAGAGCGVGLGVGSGVGFTWGGEGSASSGAPTTMLGETCAPGRVHPRGAALPGAGGWGLGGAGVSDASAAARGRTAGRWTRESWRWRRAWLRSKTDVLCGSRRGSGTPPAPDSPHAPPPRARERRLGRRGAAGEGAGPFGRRIEEMSAKRVRIAF